MNAKTNRVSVYQLSAVGLMTAVVFVANFISIPIGDVSRIHFGNVFCVLAGLLLGPVRGGICAGLGGFFYDFFNPLYAAEAPITFCLKFVIGFFSGAVSHSKGNHGGSMGLNIAGAVTGSLAYVVLYLAKNYINEAWLLRNPMETVMVKLAAKGAASLTNAAIAVVVAVVLAPVFVKAMKAAGIYTKLYPAET
ncbi:MAG TPA: ECF transporter S component [Candidatus Fimivivens faecavium]|nr:ECF transporter S component [Candidatus Fimivivens faecavium]